MNSTALKALVAFLADLHVVSRVRDHARQRKATILAATVGRRGWPGDCRRYSRL